MNATKAPSSPASASASPASASPANPGPVPAKAPPKPRRTYRCRVATPLIAAGQMVALVAVTNRHENGRKVLVARLADDGTPCPRSIGLVTLPLWRLADQFQAVATPAGSIADPLANLGEVEFSRAKFAN